MQYSPKLKGAMEEIKAILKKHDIAGAIVLHTPGHSEYLMKVDPTYSCARLEGERLRIKASLQNNFKGDKKAFLQTTSDTSNMLNLLGMTMGNLSIGIMDVSKMMDDAVNAQHFDGGHTSHTQQNN